MHFVGSFDYQLDDRNRVPIPPVYRAAFRDGGFLATGTDSYLVLHTQESFAQAAELLESLPPESDEGEDARRDFYSNAYPIQVDAQGRMLITQHLLEYAELTKEVKVVGVGRRMEIWDRAAWEAREEQRQAVRRTVVNRGAGQLSAAAGQGA